MHEQKPGQMVVQKLDSLGFQPAKDNIVESGSKKLLHNAVCTRANWIVTFIFGNSLLDISILHHMYLYLQPYEHAFLCVSTI